MSDRTPRGIEPDPASNPSWGSEDALLEALLSSDRIALERARLDPRSAAELTRLEHLLETTRLAYGSGPDGNELDAHREAALVDRILQATTRQDLSWRGDLLLLRSFLGERLRASRPLRWVAASLVAHVVALPAVAWYLRPAPAAHEPRLLFELPSPVAPDPFSSTESWVELPEPRADERGIQLAAMENARRRARFRLRSARGAAPGATAPVTQAEPGVGALLAARLAYLNDGSWWPVLGDASSWRNASRLERALRLEVLLDRWLLEGQGAGPLAEGLSDLSRSRAPGAPADAAQELVEHTLERARAYDRWTAQPAFRPESVQAVLAPEWLTTLEGALEPGSPQPELDALRRLAEGLPH